MINANSGQAVGTILLGLVGLWFAYSYRRQVSIQLAERRLDAYVRLWAITRPTMLGGALPLSPDQCRELHDEMARWYFDDGDGLFLSVPTRDLFHAVRSNLVCDSSDFKPAALAQGLGELSADEAARRRGCLCIRQTSLLRTQIKSDLSIHFGYYASRVLRADDSAFLRSCGLSLWRKPWRRTIRLDRHDLDRCVCGYCTP